MSAGIVFLICFATMWCYIKLKPPGIAYTYCWLFCCFVSSLTESVDALALSFCIGFGLNLSWYTTQLVDSLLWSNLIPYWHEYFPHWCTESLLRIGDILLHPLPLYFLIPYHRHVDWRIGLYAFLFERLYFILVEGQPLGTGCVTNIIYDFRPHLPLRSFLLSQYLTNLGYLICAVSQIGHPFIRVSLQIVLCSFFLFLCIIHTDRWNNRKHELPVIAGRFVGVALEQPIAEEYALFVNAYSQQLHNQLMERMGDLMSSEIRAQLLASLPSPRDLGADLWRGFPKGLMLSRAGLTAEGISGVVVWEKLATVIATLACKLGQMRQSVSGLELPSLEALHIAFPNVDLGELAIIRSILETVTNVIRPITLAASSTTAGITVTEEPLSAEATTPFFESAKAVKAEEHFAGLNFDIYNMEEKETLNGESVEASLRRRHISGGTSATPLAVAPLADTLGEKEAKDDAVWVEAIQALRRMLWPEPPTISSEKTTQ